MMVVLRKRILWISDIAICFSVLYFYKVIYRLENERRLTTIAMKKRRESGLKPEYKEGENAFSANDNAAVYHPVSVCAFTGRTQEDYVNPVLLGICLAFSITDMSFNGPWL